MRLHVISTVLFLALTASASAQPRKREAFEVAVDNAIEYLAKSQNNDGSWNSGRMGGGGFGVGGFQQVGSRDPAVSALCVMAFLSAGHVPGEGRYGGVIEKGVRYVASCQQQNGLFASQEFGMTVMYSHGICTLMVAEVIGLMPDKAVAEQLRGQLVRGVQLIRSAQSRNQPHDGGWRYQIVPRDADISVTGWQIMALRAAKNVGCDVPATTIDRAVAYVRRCWDPASGGYRYTTNSRVTIPCTAASILSLELCGKEYHKSEESMRAASFITKQLANELRGFGRMQPQHFFYGVYYTSQAMFQIGGQYWLWYRQVLHALLMNPTENPQQPGGFWTSTAGDDQNAGVNYCTAMAVLALTVEYRFLPIYQRSEEGEERDK